MADVILVTRLLRHLGDNAGELVRVIASTRGKKGAGTGEDVDIAQIGLRIVMACYDAVFEPTIDWLASLCGLSREAFEAMPPAALPAVIDNLVHSEDARDFFTTCWSLYRSMPRSVTPLRSGSGA